MKRSKGRLASVLALVAVLTLVAASCASDDETGSDTDTTEDGGGGASGNVVVSGSSTVEPISIRVAELLEETGSEVTVDVDGPGTGDGFELFCNGETDISDASRPIKEEEIAACDENEIEFIELKIAIDGLSVLTSPANEIECLNFADMYALMGPESQDVANWSDAQDLAAELGSATVFPDAPLDISAPGAESGTYDSFIELVTAGIGEVRAEEGAITEDEAETLRNFPGQSDDNIIIQGIEGSDSSFGWVGFAFAEEAGDGVREIPVAVDAEGCDTAVEPTVETIASGDYPIARDLFIYVNAAAAEENAAVAEYVDFYLGDGLAAVSEVGYVDLPADAVTATQGTWDARTTGTQVEG